MAVNTEPIFIASPQLWSVTVTNTLARDGTGGVTPTLLVPSSTYGALIEEVWAIPIATTTEPQNVIRLFVSSGGTYELIREVATTAISSTGNNIAMTVFSFSLPDITAPTGATGLRLPPTTSLYVALGTTPSAGGFQLNAQGGYY